MIDLTLEISKRLEEYTEEVQEKIEVAADELTKQAVEALKKTSPKRKGKYAKSWTRKKTANGYVIHNKRYYLTHLLENGHAKRDGGRVEGKKHIAPVEERTVKSFEEAVRRAISDT